jgi:hypothetical protein
MALVLITSHTLFLCLEEVEEATCNVNDLSSSVGSDLSLHSRRRLLFRETHSLTNNDNSREQSTNSPTVCRIEAALPTAGRVKKQ